MKIKFSQKVLLLLLVLFLPATAFSHDFVVDGIYYDKTSANTASVANRNNYVFSMVYSGDVVIPETVTYDGVSYTVTGISKNAFCYCGSLTSITLPNTLKSIGNSAFHHCTQLENVTLPSKLELIDGEAFYCCSTLTRLVIPKSVVTINELAFGFCSNLTSIEVEDGNPNYDSRNNCNAIIETASNTLICGCENTVIPNTVTTIGIVAFEGRNGLTNVTIPSSVTSIEERAFSYCKDLTCVTIPNTVTSIKSYLFYDCTSLATINLPNTIEKVEPYAFTNTAWLNNQPDGVVYICNTAYKYNGTAPIGTIVTIKDGTQYILAEAFDNCKGLSEVIIPGSVTSIGYHAFYCCTDLKNVVLGDSVGEQHMIVENGAFSLCTALENLTVGNSVSSINSNVFEGCNNISVVNIFDLESWLKTSCPNVLANAQHLYLNGAEIEHLVIPNTIWNIRDYAFYGCHSIKSIDFPITTFGVSIGNGTFFGCDSIETIICRESDPPYFVSSSSEYRKASFSSYDATVKVPIDHVQDYQSDSKWSNFFNIIGFNDHFSIDSINYLITSTNTVSVVSHNLEYEYKKELIIPEHVDFEGVTYAVTAINDEAFRSCDFLWRVVIPNTVITIGTSAFEYCSDLRDVTIGNSVVSIGNSAFYNCYYLNRVTLGNSVVSIGDYAFAHNMPVPPSYDYGSDEEPFRSLIIPSSVESIGEGAFTFWWNLSSVNLRSVKTIGGSAFYGCPQLATVILGSNLASIGRGAFACRNEDIMNLVASFGSEVAESFSNLRLDIICMAPVPPICVNNLVGDFLLDKTCLFVLRDALEDYMSAQVWSDIPQCYPIESEYNYDVDFIVDGICYLINEDNDHEVKVVPFTTYGDGYYIYDIPFYSGDITIPEVVNYQGEDYTVTSIDGTFAETGITSISLPCSITRIDNYAFSRCTYLRNVHLPNTITEIGEYAFNECTNLTDINIPSSLEGLGDWIFNQCENLSSIYIPASISYFGSGTFDGCSSLSHIEVSRENGTFDSRDNCNAVIETATNTLVLGCKNTIIPNSVTRIGDAAFSGCSGLTSINIPNSVTSIGWSAFSGCTGLTNIELPINLTSVEPYTFYECRALSGIIVPNSVTSVGYSAFEGCDSLASIEVPNSVTSIGNSAFKFCYSLTSIELPINLNTIESETFYYCGALTGIIIPNSVMSIGDETFYGCNNLADISIPNSVVSVGADAFSSTKWFSNQPDGLVYAGRVAYKYKGTMPSDTNIELRDDIVSISSRAFRNCKGLVNITLPATLSVIGSYAFYGCTGLTGIEFPDSVRSIGSSAFYGCTSLNSVTCLATTPPAMSYGAFSNSTYSSATLRVPMTSVNAYKAANEWKRFINVVGIINIGDTIEVDSIYYQINEGNVVTVVSRGEGNSPYSGDIVIPESIDYDGVRFVVTSIGDLAFVNCSGLTSITIPNSVITIGSGAFFSCSGLTNIIIPNSVTIIGDEAFWYCSGLTSASIGSSVTIIGNYAFSNCAGLTEITIPSSVTYIGSFAFSDCTALKTLNYNAISCDLGIIVFPYNISTLNIGDSVQKIPAWFAYGFSLENITIPNSVTEIGEHAFSICSLTSITIPNSVTTISDAAFEYCRNMDKVYSYILDPSLITMGEDVFILDPENYDERILYVPFGSSALYYADNRWHQYFGSIVEMGRVYATLIELDMTTASLNLGETLQLTSTIMPEDVSDKTVIWRTSDEAVAVVTDDGLVTAIASGIATITATTNDGSNLSAACTVTVSGPLPPVGENAFLISDTTVMHGDVIALPVAMANNESIMAFQTDIFLPEGFTIVADNDNEYFVTPADRMSSDHFIMTNDANNGSVRVVCYTPQSIPFSGNEGTLFYIHIQVPDEAEGFFSINLRNTRLTTTDFNELSIPDVSGTIEVKQFIPGDVNGSCTVTVTDIVIAAQYVLDMNPSPFIFEAADMNSDGNVTVTDIMLIAYLINHPTMNAPKRMPALDCGNDRMSGEDVTLMAGETRKVSIQLNNEMDYTAFQMDLTLPAGLTASNFQLTDRAGSHTFDVNTLGNGKTRALCYSPAIEVIDGHEGALLTFDVKATDDIEGFITVDGIELVTAGCQTVLMNSFTIGVNSATSVNELNGAKTVARVDYFNLAGQQIDRPVSGVTLVVTTYTDGTRSTTKVIK